MTVVLVLALASSASAADCGYQGVAGATWHDPLNWSCGHIPLNSDDVVLAGSDSVAVTTNDEVAGTLTLDTGATLTFGNAHKVDVTGATTFGTGTVTGAGSLNAGNFAQLTGATFGTRNFADSGTTPGHKLVVQGTGSPPVAGTPTVTGTPAVGQTVTCNEGTWTGSPAFTYQWLRDGAELGTETGRDHVVTAADANHDLSCRVTGTNDDGSDVATSAGVHVPAVAPQSTSPTTIAGTPEVGGQLTCTPGSFSGAPTPAVAIAWLRDGQAIASQSGSTYTVVAADAGHAIACRATGSNAGGSASSTSSSLDVPFTPTAGTPSVTGTVGVGRAVTCSEGTWTGNPAFTYAWQRDGAAIGGATGRTYLIDAADATHQLACRVRGAIGATSLEATSAAVAVPAVAPIPTADPVLGGTPATGKAMTCTGAVFSGIPAPTTSIRWLRDGVLIDGAAGASYTVVAADAGHALACRVTATNAGGSTSATSTPLDVERPLDDATAGQIGAAFGLPRNNRCLPRRTLVLQTRAPAGVQIKRLRVLVDGDRIKTRKRRGHYVARIDLGDIHGSSFVVEIRVRTRDGRTLVGRKTYRVCPKKRADGGKQRTDGGES